MFPSRKMAEMLQFVFIAGFLLIKITALDINFENGIPCGRQFIRRGKIVGGRNAEEGEVPWIASVYLRGTYSCVGSIIAKRWIVSAAHCFYSSSRPQNFYVRVGSYYMDGRGKSVDIGVEKIIKHPNFGNPRRYSNDIALLKVTNDIIYNNYTWPICLDRDNIDLNNKTASIAGWGKLREGGSAHPDVLQIVRLSIVNNKMCQKWFKDNGKKWMIIEDSQICAGYKEGGKDACQGDSGGPQYIKHGNANVLIGVVSSGIGCARPQTPGLYARINSHISWIDKTMQENL